MESGAFAACAGLGLGLVILQQLFFATALRGFVAEERRKRAETAAQVLRSLGDAPAQRKHSPMKGSSGTGHRYKLHKTSVRDHSPQSTCSARKHTDEGNDENCELQSKECMVFAGTAIANGQCRGIVTEIGMATEIGKVQEMITDVEDEDTPLNAGEEEILDGYAFGGTPAGRQLHHNSQFGEIIDGDVDGSDLTPGTSRCGRSEDSQRDAYKPVMSMEGELD